MQVIAYAPVGRQRGKFAWDTCHGLKQGRAFIYSSKKQSVQNEAEAGHDMNTVQVDITVEDGISDDKGWAVLDKKDLSIFKDEEGRYEIYRFKTQADKNAKKLNGLSVNVDIN